MLHSADAGLPRETGNFDAIERIATSHFFATMPLRGLLCRFAGVVVEHSVQPSLAFSHRAGLSMSASKASLPVQATASEPLTPAQVDFMIVSGTMRSCSDHQSSKHGRPTRAATPLQPAGSGKEGRLLPRSRHRLRSPILARRIR